MSEPPGRRAPARSRRERLAAVLGARLDDLRLATSALGTQHSVAWDTVADLGFVVATDVMGTGSLVTTAAWRTTSRVVVAPTSRTVNVCCSPRVAGKRPALSVLTSAPSQAPVPDAA